MASAFLYAVSYDLGFAPNPFGGVCSLACCKPNIRNQAQIGDWVIGMGGTKIKAVGRCVFAMLVTKTMTFDEYWEHPNYKTRRPKRNGSPKKQVGDNIYHRRVPDEMFLQEDSVHSLADGSSCILNTAHDTRIDRILLSNHFIYYGEKASAVPTDILDNLGYARNARDYRKFDLTRACDLIDWIETLITQHPNAVLGDPFDFGSTSKRYSASLQRLV